MIFITLFMTEHISSQRLSIDARFTLLAFSFSETRRTVEERLRHFKTSPSILVLDQNNQLLKGLEKCFKLITLLVQTFNIQYLSIAKCFILSSLSFPSTSCKLQITD